MWTRNELFNCRRALCPSCVMHDYKNALEIWVTNELGLIKKGAKIKPNPAQISFILSPLTLLDEYLSVWCCDFPPSAVFFIDCALHLQKRVSVMCVFLSKHKLISACSCCASKKRGPRMHQSYRIESKRSTTIHFNVLNLIILRIIPSSLILPEYKCPVKVSVGGYGAPHFMTYDDVYPASFWQTGERGEDAMLSENGSVLFPC